MKPIPFVEANTIYKAPGAGDLPAFNQPGSVVITAWQPTAADLDRLAAGSPIWLLVFGGGTPPVNVCTEDPFIPAADGERIAAIAQGAPHCGQCRHFQSAGGMCLHHRRATAPHYLCASYEPKQPAKK